MAVAFGSLPKYFGSLPEFCWLTHLTHGVRRGGAAAVDLAFVASGKVDGFWERGLAKWDMAAGVPIVEMAGGIVSNYPSGDFDLNTGRILACNPEIQNEFIKELGKISNTIVEIGPKKVLSGLVKKNNESLHISSFSSYNDIRDINNV